MIFTTLQFLLFFLVVFPLLFAIPKGWRLPMLLAASYYFYMCSVPLYLLVIVGITIIDFIAAIKLEEAHSGQMKVFFLVLSVCCNFGLLFAFKYAGFFAVTINGAFGVSLPVLRLP